VEVSEDMRKINEKEKKTALDIIQKQCVNSTVHQLYSKSHVTDCLTEMKWFITHESK